MNAHPVGIDAGRPIDRTASIWTLLVATTINEAMLLVLPSFVGALGDNLILSQDQIGLLGSADMIGIAISTATGPLWLRRVNWRVAGIGTLVAFLLVNLACVGCTSFAPLLWLRVLAGLIAGIGYTVGLAGVLATRNPDRNAGLLLVVQTAFSALGVYAPDAVPLLWRLRSVYIYIAVCIPPALIAAWFYYPSDPGTSRTETAINWGEIAARGSAVVIGAGLYFLMIGGVWGYLEGVAREAGLSLSQTGQALSVGLVISLAGAGAAAYVGLKFGRALPLALSGTVQIIALYLLLHLNQFSNPVTAFYVINAIFQVMWSFIIPYFMVMFAEVEPTGRFVSMYGTSTHLTLAIGPYLGAFFIVDGHHRELLWLGIALAGGCYVSFLVANWLGAVGKRRPVTAAAT